GRDGDLSAAIPVPAGARGPRRARPLRGAGPAPRADRELVDPTRVRWKERSMPTMHAVDYQILGDDMQYVRVELDPQEAVVAEAGAMMYIEDGIAMDTVFGDGSQQNQGLMGALLGAGKRLLTGESLFMTVFQNQ